MVVGGSAGGVEALKRFISSLPGDLPATVCVSLHLGTSTPSLLASILARGSSLRVEAAYDGAPVEPGVVYVAQSDVHLVVLPGRLQLGTGPRENGHRPSLDALLRSAALAYGPRVVGVVLTGMLDDGSAGLARVHRYGGLALVQDPDEAEFPSMPRNALAATPEALRLPLAGLVEKVVTSVNSDFAAPADPVDVRAVERERDTAEVRSALGLDPALPDGGVVGNPSPYSCPDCGGVLNDLDDGAVLRFRCRVGHAYSADSLLHSQRDTIEDALYTALRALEERTEISDRLAEDARGAGREWSRAHFRRRADEARASSAVLRSMLTEHRAAEDAAVGGSAAT